MEPQDPTCVQVETISYHVLELSQLFPLQGDLSPLFDVTKETLDDSCVSSEKVLQDVRYITDARGFNIDLPVDCGDRHGESL